MSDWITVPGETASVALALVNSLHAGPNGDIDHLASPEAAASWLRSRGLLQSDTVLREVSSLAQLRAAVRELFLAFLEERDADPAAVDTVNEAAAATPGASSVAWPPTGPVRTWSTIRPGTLAEALAAIAGDAIDVLCTERAATIRVCEAHGCVRVFFREHARRRWCSTTCGDRVRAARHYRSSHS
ncbi:CGNR zinc finger domain-containing protein [Fodinicola feengrottensis]|uniref:CGNR zinc finger domain-containing protein n=1 Tax=Fodinicola feengrottensis TaxID=435914 RepID=A0ABN2IQV5_9ACTN|nr:CGNR zinc finger domain-containing protein [Fodinicola feengrottensis]